VALAAGTAAISGVAVWVNSHGVRRVPDAAVYTTAKNLVAAAVLVAVLVALSRRRSPAGWTRPANRGQWAGLGLVAVIGGSVPFVLFFEGLSRATATDAAFLHKTLVVWVAILAVSVLGERLSGLHLAAIGLLLVGQAALAVDLGGLRPGGGELLVLAATWCWAVETVIAKRLLVGISPLTLGSARLGLGGVVLLGWLVVQGQLGALAGLSASQWAWAALTGALLAGYVATWFAALARAGAIDVTAVLVPAAIVTAVLQTVVDGRPIDGRLTGLALIAAGGALAALAALRHAPAHRELPA